MANKLRASGQIQDKDRYIPISEAKKQMVAMLTDLKTEIETKENHYEQAFKQPSNAVHEAAMCGRMFGCGECKEVIQQKIDILTEKNT